MVIKLTRWWVRVYTAGLRADRRDARRAEIDSDIWEQQRYAEATGTGHGLTALLMVERLLLSPNPPKDRDGRREDSGRG